MSATIRNMSRKLGRGSADGALTANKPCLKKRMCAHVAWALLVHTVLILLLIGHSISDDAGSLVAHMVMIAMLALFILIARDFHYRWRRKAYLEKHGEAGMAVIAKFRRDVAILWAIALGLPFFWLLLT